MRKLALIIGSAIIFSQSAMAEAPYARGGLDKEQTKFEREAKLERDKQFRKQFKQRKEY